ncbi:hypothetical protein VTO42DRAFT_2028 [Malbranchea cinnamomea]
MGARIFLAITVSPIQDFKVESREEFNPTNMAPLRNLSRRLHKTVKGDGASQKDNSGVQKDSKRSKGEGGKLPYDEYRTRREKGLCYMCSGPGHKSSECKTTWEKDSKSKDSKDDSSKDAPTSGYKAYMVCTSSLPLVRPWESKTRMFEINIVVLMAFGIEHNLRAMIDSGADVSFISVGETTPGLESPKGADKHY